VEWIRMSHRFILGTWQLDFVQWTGWVFPRSDSKIFVTLGGPTTKVGNN